MYAKSIIQGSKDSKQNLLQITCYYWTNSQHYHQQVIYTNITTWQNITTCPVTIFTQTWVQKQKADNFTRLSRCLSVFLFKIFSSHYGNNSTTNLITRRKNIDLHACWELSRSSQHRFYGLNHKAYLLTFLWATTTIRRCSLVLWFLLQYVSLHHCRPFFKKTRNLHYLCSGEI